MRYIPDGIKTQSFMQLLLFLLRADAFNDRVFPKTLLTEHSFVRYHLQDGKRKENDMKIMLVIPLYTTINAASWRKH